jgi:hypothetical protein
MKYEKSYFLHGCIVVLVAWNIALTVHLVEFNQAVGYMDDTYFATTNCAVNDGAESYAAFQSCVENARVNRVQDMWNAVGQ